MSEKEYEKKKGGRIMAGRGEKEREREEKKRKEEKREGGRGWMEGRDGGSRK